MCFDPGFNLVLLDLQSNALPIELSRHTSDGSICPLSRFILLVFLGSPIKHFNRSSIHNKKMCRVFNPSPGCYRVTICASAGIQWKLSSNNAYSSVPNKEEREVWNKRWVGINGGSRNKRGWEKWVKFEYVISNILNFMKKPI